MSRRIQRRRQRSTRRLVLILCEGTVESAYFTRLRRILGKRGVEYKIIPLEGDKLFSALSRTLQQQEWDVVQDAWLVLDTEDQAQFQRRQEKLKSAIPRKYRQRLHLCWSHPSIERWFLLHFEDSSAAFSQAQGAIQRLRQHYSDYSKDTKSIRRFLSFLYPAPCFEACLRCALERAQRLEAAAQAIGAPTPTQIHRLIQAIFPAVQPVAGEDCREVCQQRRC